MTDPLYRFDDFWSSFRSEDLKRMAVVWGGGNKLRKDECIDYLRAVLTDPARIDAALARMRPQERAALCLINLFGGTVELGALGIAVRTTGTLPMPAHYESSYHHERTEQALIDRGIVMPKRDFRYLSYSYTESVEVFADARITARIGPLQYQPLPLDSVALPVHSTFRRAQSVVLDVISIVRAVDELGGIGLTKTGELRTNDLRKFTRKMGWADQIEIDGLTFPEPTRAHLFAMSNSGLLTRENDALVASAPLEHIGGWPAVQILRKLVLGISRLKEWTELQPTSTRFWFRGNSSKGRLAILTALRCLPDRLAWFEFERFERTLFERIGENFSVNGTPSRPYFYDKSTAEKRVEMHAWRNKVREAWEKNDVPWLQAVFQTWLYAFGLVELSLVDGIVDRFRLTDVARALLWGEPTEEAAQAPAEQTPAWVVQPNFDIVVYLGSASTAQVAFLEQHAERVQVAQHTAQYRLTRDSVYEGMQRGIDVECLIEGLAAGSRVELPSNVVAEIRTWAKLRDRITLRCRAELIEFQDAVARQSAIASGIAGLTVGDRFLLLPANYKDTPVATAAPQVVDYSDKPVSGCLRITEDGVMTLAMERRDLLTRGYLDLWALRENNDTWRLTCESVAAAMRRGRTLADLLAFLQSRLKQGIPGILTVALRAWAGESVKAGVNDAVLLRCPQPDVLAALLASQTLKPYLLGKIGPDAILVNSAGAEKVRAVLEWAGIRG